MTQFFAQFGVWLGVGTAVIIGIIALYGQFDAKARARRKDEDGVEDRVIKLLQTEVEELTKKVNKQDADIKILTEKVNSLQSENHTLVTVLQGRDQQTQQFYKDAYVAMEKVGRTQDTVRSLHDEVSKLVASINVLVSQKTPQKNP